MKYLKYLKENLSDHNIKKIVDSYLECALFTEDVKNKTIHDFSKKARDRANTEIVWFVSTAGNALDNIEDNLIGQDLWYSRNGHGSGFWDNDYDDDVVKILMDLSGELGEIYLYKHKGKIYFEGGNEKYKEFDIEKYHNDIKKKKTLKNYNLFFNESLDLEEEEDLDQFKDQIEVVFGGKNYNVIKPKSFEGLLYLSQGTEWRIANINTKYYNGKDFPKKYYFNDNVYVNVDKTDENKKILFDFQQSHFYDEDEDDIYLNDFFEKNKDLFNFYGEIVNCDNVVKENGEYWIVVSDYPYFEDYFKLDRNTRDDLIKMILNNEAYELFMYNISDFKISDRYNKWEIDNESLLLIKVLLWIIKLRKNYDYGVVEIKDYDDIVEIIKEYKIKSLKKLFKECMCKAQETADSDAAYNDVTDEIYKFFGLVLGTAKWQHHANSQDQKLWIKFKTNTDAYYAKFLINNYDDSYSDDKIEYSHGYSFTGDDKVRDEYFNDNLKEKLWSFEEYDSEISGDDIHKYNDYWKEMIENNPNLVEEEILDKIKRKIKIKNYNLK